MSEQFFDVKLLRRRPKTRKRVVAWIEALRSGKYKRGTSALHKVRSNGEVFCCLGVACDLVDSQWDVIDIRGYHDLADSEANFLSPKGLELYGLESGVQEGSAQRRLANLNDGKGGSFKRIARRLEKAYEAALA